MTRRRTPVLASLGVAASLLVFAACGGDDDSADAATASTAAATDASAAEFSAADVTFAQGMIPHHEQAIEMAEYALDPATGASAEVVALATQIQAAQDPEIEQMRGLLTAWQQPMEDPTVDHSEHGMMTDEEMAGLDALTGTAFDQRWLEMMIEHHEGAITMAEEVQADGQSLEIATLATRIIEAQRAEIAEMQGLIGG